MASIRGPGFATLLWSLILVSSACHSDASSPCDGCGAPKGRISPQSLVVWSDSQAFAVARPVFDDRAVYFLGIHQVTAVNKATGAPIWQISLQNTAGPSSLYGIGTAMASGRLIVGDLDVFGIDPTTGAVIWQFAPSRAFPHERSFQRLATDGATVFVGGVWGNVYALDAATGTQRWISHVTTLPDSNIRVFNPVVVDGTVYVAFADTPSGALQINGGVSAIDVATGRLLWSQGLPHHFGGPTSETENVAIVGDRAVAGAWDGFLYALDRRTGTLVDSVAQTTFGFASGTTQATVFYLAAVGTTVIVGTDNAKLVAFDGRSLQSVLWSTTVSGAVFDVVADSTRVYVPNGGADFSVNDLADGKQIWGVGVYELRRDGENFLAAPAFDGLRIYLGSDHDFYAFKRQ